MAARAPEGTIDVTAKYVTTTIAIPTNTATQSVTFALGERLLDTLDVHFTPGHAGLTGLRVSYAGVTILPWNQPSAFLVGDNERRLFEMGLHISGPLTLTTRNLDKGFPHSIIVTAKLREIVLVTEAPPAPLTLLDLSA
jgi:hypothetical protein